ncbi:MAG: isoprenylcysteine carboxylmethyltransferase family protein [Actinomycetota bacterium]|nr:isoprenylcysteine carboxylmethyltransferase family protein [Actinomycetota bacterium]
MLTSDRAGCRCETAVVLPVFYDHPIAAGVFWVAYAVSAAVEVTVAWRSRDRATGPADLDRGSKRFVVASIWVAFIAGFTLGGAVAGAVIAESMPLVRWVVFGVGVALIVFGAGLRQWAITTLGRFFTLEVRIAEDQPVIDSGPYRLVRHPSYAGALLTFLGIGLALGNWLSPAVLALVPTLGFVRRITVEEQALSAQLGDSYRRYAATHRRLIPGLW